jgi:hypothetical protein
MNITRLLLPSILAIALGLALTVTAAEPPAKPGADALAEKLLAAIGGRGAWAGLRNTVNDSQQFRAGNPVEVRAVIAMDFERPRFRIDTTGPGLKLTRVIDGERDWRITADGKLSAYTAAAREDDLRWYAGHVYRTIHRVAKRDSALKLGIGGDGRLEVSESGKRIAWFKLTATGEPYAFGAHADDVGSISGPWKFERDGIRHPVWVSNADGTWRAGINGLQTNVTFDAALFARPAEAR